MTEIFWSWPWYDRLVIGVSIGVVVFGTIAIERKLDHIIKLLERSNELELRKQRPDLFD